jgi:hypothetical protein
MATNAILATFKLKNIKKYFNFNPGLLAPAKFVGLQNL